MYCYDLVGIIVVVCGKVAYINATLGWSPNSTLRHSDLCPINLYSYLQYLCISYNYLSCTYLLYY